MSHIGNICKTIGKEGSVSHLVGVCLSDTEYQSRASCAATNLSNSSSLSFHVILMFLLLLLILFVFYLSLMCLCVVLNFLRVGEMTNHISALRVNLAIWKTLSPRSE